MPKVLSRRKPKNITKGGNEMFSIYSRKNEIVGPHDMILAIPKTRDYLLMGQMLLLLGFFLLMISLRVKRGEIGAPTDMWQYVTFSLALLSFGWGLWRALRYKQFSSQLDPWVAAGQSASYFPETCQGVIAAVPVIKKALKSYACYIVCLFLAQEKIGLVLKNAQNQAEAFGEKYAITDRQTQRIFESSYKELLALIKAWQGVKKEVDDEIKRASPMFNRFFEMVVDQWKLGRILAGFKDKQALMNRLKRQGWFVNYNSALYVDTWTYKWLREIGEAVPILEQGRLPGKIPLCQPGEKELPVPELIEQISN